VKWFRLYSEILDDHKMMDLTDREYRIMTYLMAYASELDKAGAIPFCLDKIAWRLRFPSEDVEGTIKKLRQLRILQDNGTGIQFVNWDKRQFVSDDNTKRWREWYKKKKKETSNVGSNVEPNVADTDTDTDTENISTLKSTRPQKADVPPCPHQEIIKLYHEILPELCKVKTWDANRQRMLKGRWRGDKKRQDLEWWKKFFMFVHNSPFLMGDKKDFQADLEWLIRPQNFAKVIEGKYNRK
jgi:hypothetical protein